MGEEEQENMSKAQLKGRLARHTGDVRRGVEYQVSQGQDSDFLGTILTVFAILGVATFIGCGLIGSYIHFLGGQ